MNSINQHVDGIPLVKFETTEELLNIDFVKSLSNLSTFKNFSVDKRHKNLICETTDEKWYVAGELEFTDLDLPEWKAKNHYFTYS